MRRERGSDRVAVQEESRNRSCQELIITSSSWREEINRWQPIYRGGRRGRHRCRRRRTRDGRQNLKKWKICFSGHRHRRYRRRRIGKDRRSGSEILHRHHVVELELCVPRLLSKFTAELIRWVLCRYLLNYSDLDERRKTGMKGLEKNKQRQPGNGGKEKTQNGKLGLSKKRRKGENSADDRNECVREKKWVS